jgi:hypothetical protein
MNQSIRHPAVYITGCFSDESKVIRVQRSQVPFSHSEFLLLTYLPSIMTGDTRASSFRKCPSV